MADIIKKVNALGLLDQYTIAKSLGQEDEFCKSFGVNIEKAEGDRGGKIMGHTASGKPIYEPKKGVPHPDTSHFSKQDHLDAGSLIHAHMKTKDNKTKAGHHSLYSHHYEAFNKMNSKDDSNHNSSVFPNYTAKHAKETEKSLDIDIEKGGKAAAIGEIREFGGKKYQKQANGWRPVKKGNQKGTYDKQIAVAGKTIEELNAMKSSIQSAIANSKNDDYKKQASEKIKEIDAELDSKSSTLDLSKHSKQELLDAMAVRAKSGVSESDPEMKQLQAEIDKRGAEKKELGVGDTVTLTDENHLASYSKFLGKDLKILKEETIHFTSGDEKRFTVESSDGEKGEIKAKYLMPKSKDFTSKPTHIGDMSKEEKYAAAAKFGIQNPEKLSAKELDKQLTDKNIEAELKKFKESKGEKKESVSSSKVDFSKLEKRFQS